MVEPLVECSMAQAITASEPEPEHVEKTITLIAYSAEHRANPRNFAEEFADIDMFEKEERESHDCTLWYRTGDRNVSQEWITYRAYQSLEGNVSPEQGVWVTDNVTKSEDYVNDPSKASQDLIKRLVNEHTPREVGDLSRIGGTRWSDDTYETHVRISSDAVKERDVLTHQSVRSADNRFEEPVPRMSLQWTITMDGTPSKIDMYTQEIVNPLMTHLGRHENVSKVRLSACQETVTKAGDCFESL